MNKTPIFKNYDWSGWRLKDNKFGDEFDLAARGRMVQGCRELMVFIKKYKRSLGRNILEIGPFFDPLIKPSSQYKVYYLDRDKFVQGWLRSNKQRVYGIDLNKKYTLPNSFFSSVVVSQVFNYIDYEKFLKKINGSLVDNGLLLVNNVTNYGIKKLFHKNKPTSLEQTVKVIKSTGYDILEKKIIEFSINNERFKRLLVVAKKGARDIVVLGKVIHGEHLGRKLGFPTANIDRRDFIRQNLKVKLGVYAGRVEVDGRLLGLPQKTAIKGSYRAAIVIGPIDHRGLPKLEAHLIGFKGNLYGKKMVLYLGKYIRPFKKFASVDLLKEQIKRDIQEIRKLGN